MSDAAGTWRGATIAPGRASISPWLIAPTVGLAAFMEVLDTSIANVALEHIAGSLSATPDESTWVLTSYLLTNAIVLPISGWLSSVFGRKRYFLASIIGFSVASLFCGLVPTLALLVIVRGLQGAAGGGLQPTAQAFLADAFPPEKRGQAFAMYGLAVIFAPAIGPTVGGWITDNFSWRWVFLLNVPVGLVLTVLAIRFLADPADEVAARRARRGQGITLDYLGFSLLVVGMCALQVVLDKGQEDDWFASSLITDLSVTAVIALTAFVVWELRRADPIVDLRLLGNRSFAIGNLLMFTLGFVLLGTTVLLPEFAQILLGYTAAEAGLVMSPGGFVSLLTLPVVGALSSRIEPRWLIAIGLASTALALYHMTSFDLNIDYSTIAWARVYQSLGLSLLFIPINTAAYRGVPRDKSNNASAIINMMRNIGGSIGIAMVTMFIDRQQQYHQNVLVAHVTPYSNQYNQFIQTVQQTTLPQHASAVDALHQAQALLYSIVQVQASVLSYIDAFWLLSVIMMALVPLVLLLRGAGGGEAPPPAH